MILGIGTDLVNIDRIGKSLEKHGDRFKIRVFTEAERNRAESRPHPVAAYAKRFAAKEACCKALGSGIAEGVFWTDMSVINLPNGRPTFELSGGAADKLQQMLPKGHRAVVHLTITDDAPWAQAFVVIEALPEE